MKILRLIKPYLSKRKYAVGLLCMLTVVLWLIATIIPYITGKYVDILVSVKKASDVLSFAIIIMSMSLVSIIGSFFMNIIQTKVKAGISFSLNYDVLEHIKRLPLFYFNGMDAAYLNQRVNSDSNTATDFVFDSCISCITNIIAIIAAAFILFSINLKIALVLIFLLPIYILLYSVFQKPLYNSNFQYRESQSRFFSKMNEQIYNIKFVKTNSLFELLGLQLRKSFGALLNSTMRYAKISTAFSSIGSMIGVLANIVLFFYGGLEVIRGRLTIGNFTIISTYFSMMLGNIAFFLSFGSSYQNAMVSYKRLSDILEEGLEPNGRLELESIQDIEFRDVSFSYDESRQLLKNFSFKFTKNNIYCIIGENGTGKSTLAGLLLGLYNGCYEGGIYYNSIDIKELDMYSIRKKLIGVTEQEPVLFNDTIMNNITCGLESYDKAKLEDWCKRLNISDFVARLELGLDTNIEEKAANISGGEKQKISHLRTLLKTPQLIIMDEPTSALDKGSIEKLKALLCELKENRIIIVVTHNQYFLDIARDIIELDNTRDFAPSKELA